MQGTMPGTPPTVLSTLPHRARGCTRSGLRVVGPTGPVERTASPQDWEGPPVGLMEEWTALGLGCSSAHALPCNPRPTGDCSARAAPCIHFGSVHSVHPGAFCAPPTVGTGRARGRGTCRGAPMGKGRRSSNANSRDCPVFEPRKCTRNHGQKNGNDDFGKSRKLFGPITETDGNGEG